LADAGMVTLPPEGNSPGLQGRKPGFRVFLVAYAAEWRTKFAVASVVPQPPAAGRGARAARAKAPFRRCEKEIGLLRIGWINDL